MVPPTPATDNTEVHKRFTKTTDENIFAIKESRFEVNTLKNTQWAIKIVRDWLMENDQNTEFEILTPIQLDNMLARFYVEVRSVNGEFYSKSGYVCIRAASQRHLHNPPHNIGITRGQEVCFSCNFKSKTFKLE